MPASASESGRRRWLSDAVETSERDVYLLLQHVSGELIYELAALLKPNGVTPEQYHVLRILRGAGTAGIALGAIAERSPSGDPDVTRLLDRLERMGLASRTRDADDRRVVTARITADGQRLLGRIDESVAALHARQFRGLGKRELQELQRLLRTVAGTPRE